MNLIDRTVEPEFMSIESIYNAYEAGHRRWRGCHWNEIFGGFQLRLKNLSARQARIIANATSGAEALAWHQAVNWLESVERDAATAETEAKIAFNLAVKGRLDEAEQHARAACELQDKYAILNVWTDLLTRIQKLRLDSPLTL